MLKPEARKRLEKVHKVMAVLKRFGYEAGMTGVEREEVLFDAYREKGFRIASKKHFDEFALEAMELIDKEENDE